MENSNSEQLKRWIYGMILILLTGLIIVALILLVQYILPLLKPVFKVLSPFIISAFIVYLFHPLVETLESKKVPRPLSILLFFSIFLVLFIVVILKGTPYVVEEVESFLDQLPMMAKTYREFIETVYQRVTFLPEAFQQQLDQWVHRGEAWIAEAIEEMGSFLMKLVDWTLLLIVIPFIVFYGLKDFPLLKKASWYLTPKRMRKQGKELAKELDQALGAYIRGQILICVIVGLLSWIGFWIIDMPYGALLAILIGLTNIIPYFGPIIGSVPVILLSLTESFQLLILGLVVVFVVQIIEGNVLAPVIVGKSIHTHPLLIIFALIIGNEMAGVIGLILAVPILAVIKVFALHWRKVIRNRKGIYD
ncbi:AI-2E family transporter [Salipaludibacillus keqinensis]|uniref:AI-2E family transporter n=1 Tax=Salipaludibacillus keqinensis TaxID=2045207 RepID=UPI0013047E10|nr:AI-2E family transporter [Salipaludibacillus keqinensis]